MELCHFQLDFSICSLDNCITHVLSVCFFTFVNKFGGGILILCSICFMFSIYNKNPITEFSCFCAQKHIKLIVDSKLQRGSI